jgi:ATP adenylyltransferase
MEYIQAAHDPEDGGCFFCDKPKQGDDRAALILARADAAFVMLNAYPYNPGHLMIAPFRHTADLEGLEDRELAAVDSLLQRSIQALREAVNADGFNLGMNLGRVAGAGVAEHLHWHVVPRWDGDTNFMPVVGGAKVLPESLEDTYAKVQPLLVR